MVMDLFGSLLQEIGRNFNVDLKPDANNSCLFKMQNGLSIQMEIDKKGDFFILGADLGEVPVGKYRENLFREALKANGLPSPRYGTFAYSRQKDHLLLVEMLPVQNLTGEKILEELKPFGEKALLWKMSIGRGEIPSIASPEKGSGGMFGLIPNVIQKPGLG